MAGRSLFSEYRPRKSGSRAGLWTGVVLGGALALGLGHTLQTNHSAELVARHFETQGISFPENKENRWEAARLAARLRLTPEEVKAVARQGDRAGYPLRQRQLRMLFEQEPIQNWQLKVKGLEGDSANAELERMKASKLARPGFAEEINRIAAHAQRTRAGISFMEGLSQQAAKDTVIRSVLEKAQTAPNGTVSLKELNAYLKELRQGTAPKPASQKKPTAGSSMIGLLPLAVLRRRQDNLRTALAASQRFRNWTAQRRR